MWVESIEKYTILLSRIWKSTGIKKWLMYRFDSRFTIVATHWRIPSLLDYLAYFFCMLNYTSWPDRYETKNGLIFKMLRKIPDLSESLQIWQKFWDWKYELEDNVLCEEDELNNGFDGKEVFIFCFCDIFATWLKGHAAFEYGPESEA